MEWHVIFVVSCIFHKAHSLQCYQCNRDEPVACPDLHEECPNLCSSVRVTKYTGNDKINDDLEKTCAAPEQCGTGSINFGVSRTVIHSQCCGVDFCNSDTPYESANSSLNGKRCFSCAVGDCSLKLNCVESEHKCFTTTFYVAGQSLTMKGCASGSLCEGGLSTHLGAVKGTGLTCCEGNLCNSDMILQQSLQLLTMSVAFIIIFL